MIVYMLLSQPEGVPSVVDRIRASNANPANRESRMLSPGLSALGRRLTPDCTPIRAAVAVVLAKLSLRFAGRTIGATRRIATVDRTVAVVVDTVAADLTPCFAVQSAVGAALTDLTTAGPTAERAR
jgi:hypothetical protein